MMEQPQFVVEEITDAETIAKYRIGLEQFQRNSDWLQDHWSYLIPGVYGKHLAVAGQEAFIGDNVDDVIARAKAAHPDDVGMFVEFVRPPLGPRIYGNRR